MQLASHKLHDLNRMFKSKFTHVSRQCVPKQ